MSFKIYDIKFYNKTKEDKQGDFRYLSPNEVDIGYHGPRRINEHEYQIEWYRKGILFKKCPKSVIRKIEHHIEDIPIESGTMVTWDRLMDQNEHLETFQIIPNDGKARFFRVKSRKPIEWLECNTIVPNNCNREVLLQIASIFEENNGIVEEIKNYQGNQDSSKELLNIKESFQNKSLTNSYQEDKVLFILQRLLPKGIDDTLCNLILKTWKSRLKERAINDLYSDNERLVANAIGFLKNNTM